MNKETFNRACAEFMGYEIVESDKENESITGIYCRGKANDSSDYEHFFSSLKFVYNPHDDLNQLAEVFDKAMSKESFLLMKFWAYAGNESVKQIPIEQAMRDFVAQSLEAA